MERTEGTRPGPLAPSRRPSCCRRPGIVASVALLLCAAGAGAAHAATGDVVINEVLLYPGHPGAELPEYESQWVEIHNGGLVAVDLTGWALSDRAGTVLAALPPWSLPAGAYLTVHWASGTDDPDFSDDDGHHYLNVTTRPFDRERDECALYSSPLPSAASIVDFLAWSSGGAYDPGPAHDFAVAAGIWTQDVFFDPDPVMIANTLGRTFNGWDTDALGDWMVYRWLEYVTVGITQPENPVQLTPQKNAVSDDDTPTFDWQDAATVTSYQLQVDDDPDFSSPVIDATVGVSEHTPVTPLPTNVYSWRVRGLDGPDTSAWSATWLFVVDTAVPLDSAALGGGMTCPFRWQRKDTQLLCIWHDRHAPNPDLRPGCMETGAHAWDVAHPDGAPPGNEPHCGNNCGRAVIAMLNARYGGDLSQDRIAYHFFKEISDKVAGPEGDLGHSHWFGGADFVNTISWALGGVPITADFAPAGGAFTFAQIKNWFDTHGCFILNIPGHFVVLNGYAEQVAGNRTMQVVTINDPARGANRRELFGWQISGAQQAGGYGLAIRAAVRQPAPPAMINGRMQEAAVTTDIDGDGVMDFDEGLPRAFQSLFNDADTDNDEVDDKNDIRNYTFHDSYHPGHDNDPLSFSDFDMDGLRSENDCDSDGPDAVAGDGDFDGGEDIDGDGHNTVPFPPGAPGARETCMFDPGDFSESVHVDRNVYFVGQAVNIVDVHPTRTTHTYHADSFYAYELGPGCPDKANDTPLSHDGIFFTDADGHAMPAFVHNCPSPGIWHLTIDVLNDFNYSEPDNTDPQTCWECKSGIFQEAYLTAMAQYEIRIPAGSPGVPVKFSGTVTVDSDLDSIGDGDSDGKEEIELTVPTGILQGAHPTMGAITITIPESGVHPMQASTGSIEEDANTTSGVLDLSPFTTDPPGMTGHADFDLYFHVEVNGQTLHTHAPKQHAGTSTHLPAGQDDKFDSSGLLPLFDGLELIVGEVGQGHLILDPIVPEIVEPGFTVTPFGPGAGAKGLECSAGGSFGNFLYVSDSAAGAIERVDPFDNVALFVAGLIFPVGGDFSLEPASLEGGGGFGDYFYVAEFGADQISRIDPNGVVTPFTPFNDPGDVKFGNGGAYGTDLFATTAFTGPMATVDSTGLPTFFSPSASAYLDFAPGGGWGTDLYATEFGGNITFNLTHPAGAGIPDGNGTLTLGINYPQRQAIHDVDVRVVLTHPNVSEVDITLRHPDGTTVDLWNRRCDTGQFGDIDTRFDDEGSAQYCNPFGPTPDPSDGDGRLNPSEPLAVLDGKDALGQWTLEITDHAAGNGGTLESWTLFVTESRTGIAQIDSAGTVNLLSRGFQAPEGFDWAFGGDWNGDMFATDVNEGKIYRVRPDGTRSLWATQAGAADVCFCNCALYIVSADGGCWKVVSDADDADGDGHADGCDNCPDAPNMDQQSAVFPQTLVATSGTEFSWGQPADVDYLRGPLDQVSSYAVDLTGPLPGATSLTDPEPPASGQGFYFMVKPSCPVGSWQTAVGAEPGRDGP